MSLPVGPEACYCFAGRRAARALARLYDRHVAPAGISISQFSILSMLGRNPGIAILDLAAIMVMERTTLVRALRPLEGEGLVARRRAAGGRALLLSLTPEGQAKLADTAPLWKAAQREFETLVGPDRARRMRQDGLEIALDF